MFEVGVDTPLDHGGEGIAPTTTSSAGSSRACRARHRSVTGWARARPCMFRPPRRSMRTATRSRSAPRSRSRARWGRTERVVRHTHAMTRNHPDTGVVTQLRVLERSGQDAVAVLVVALVVVQFDLAARDGAVGLRHTLDLDEGADRDHAVFGLDLGRGGDVRGGAADDPAADEPPGRGKALDVAVEFGLTEGVVVGALLDDRVATVTRCTAVQTSG